MEAITRDREEKATKKADTAVGAVSTSMGDGGDFKFCLETALSDCDESIEEPTTPPLEEVECIGNTRNRPGVFETHDEFAKIREDEDEDGTSASEGIDAIADVPLLTRKDCTIGRRVSATMSYLVHCKVHATTVYPSYVRVRSAFLLLTRAAVP